MHFPKLNSPDFRGRKFCYALNIFAKAEGNMNLENNISTDLAKPLKSKTCRPTDKISY